MPRLPRSLPVALFLTAFLPGQMAGAACTVSGCAAALVPTANSPLAIEQALSAAGTGGVVELCPGKVFNLDRAIVFPRGDVTLKTCGATGANPRAVLKVVSRTTASDDATAILIRKPNVTLDNITVKGEGPWTPSLGLPHGNRTALIEAGGNNGSNLEVRNCLIKEPLGWSALHVIEGTVDGSGNPTCLGAMIRDNRIVNAGHPTKLSGYSRWADGISMACGGIVTGNTIINPSDGGIVVFVPGVTVTSNTIRVDGSDRHTLGGVNLVDCVSKGNMRNIDVGFNDFEAINGGIIDMAVAVGPTVWFCGACVHGTTTYSDYDMSGSSIHHNDMSTASAGIFKYGIAVARVHGLSTSWNDYGGVTFTGSVNACGGVTPPPNRGAVVASEDLLRNTFGEGVGFWDPSYPRSQFYHLISD